MPRRPTHDPSHQHVRLRIEPEFCERVRNLSANAKVPEHTILKLALKLGLDKLDREHSSLGDILDKRDTLGRLLESEEFRVGFVSMMSHSLDQLRRMPSDRRPDVIVDHFHGEIDRYCGEARFSTDADVLESGRCEPAPGIVFQPSNKI